MRTKILLVEDDEDFGFILKQYLELSGFEVSWFQNPVNFLAIIKEEFHYDLGIFDVMMPEMNGFTLVQNILKLHPMFPSIFLTAKNQKIDRITGLKIGVDDYIAKPCDPEELILRIKNILKRSQTIIGTPIVKIGSYTLDTNKFQLRHDKTNIQLTEREMELFLYLIDHNHSVVRKEDILQRFWKNDDYFSGRSLDVFVSKLRKYLKHDTGISIKTVRGIGYEIDFPIRS